MRIYFKEEDRFWEIPEGESTIGRGNDSSFQLNSDRWPAISRRHATIISRAGVVSFRDDNSGGGTLKNGVRLSGGQLNPGDQLQLGADGPVLEVQATTSIHPGVVHDAGTVVVRKAVDLMQTQLPGMKAASDPSQTPPSQNRPAPELPTLESPLEQPLHDGATRIMQIPGSTAPTARTTPPAERAVIPAVSDQRTVVMGGSAPRQATRQDATRIVLPQTPNRAPAPAESYDDETFVPPPLPDPRFVHREDNSDELATGQHAIARKLDTMQNILYAAVVLIVALIGMLLYQDREIDQNRTAILALQQQANSSVALLLPELDQRMKRFDGRLDEIDPKMQAAENRTMERMNKELPLLLDHYFDKRMATMQSQHPDVMQHPELLANPALLQHPEQLLKKP